MKKTIIIFILLIIAAPAFCATRFYLPSAGTSTITPTFETAAGTWTDISYAAPGHLRCQTTKTYTASGTKSTPNASAGNYLCNQYVSNPIAAQTISGMVSGEIAVTESNGNVNAYSLIIIKIVSREGTVTRGTLLSRTRGIAEVTTTSLGRWTPAPVAINTITAESGDRIVVEVGISCEVQTGANATMTFLDNNTTTDLTEGGGNTLNPWIEFSQDIIFPNTRLIDN
jgi:hypothetical protein